MSKVHYFQRYSQKENVVTNNTMQLLSRLYQHRSDRFECFLNELLSDSGLQFEVGPQFEQQRSKGKGSSVPDGVISQRSSKVLIETKLYDNYSKVQLRKHLDGFGKEELQVLLLINPNPVSQIFNNKVAAEVQAFNAANGTQIRYCSVTFKMIVDTFSSVLLDYDFELKEMLEDYREYCQSSRLISRSEFTMRALLASGSLKNNLKHHIYFDPSDRGYSPHRYIGLYHAKSIRAVGMVTKIVHADFDSSSKKLLNIRQVEGDPINSNEEQRIIDIILSIKVDKGWNIETGHKFFLAEKFIETTFKKETKFPLQGAKFFDLGVELDLELLPDTQTIAETLAKKTWG
jgi:hypothetical protein